MKLRKIFIVLNFCLPVSFMLGAENTEQQHTRSRWKAQMEALALALLPRLSLKSPAISLTQPALEEIAQHVAKHELKTILIKNDHCWAVKVVIKNLMSGREEWQGWIEANADNPNCNRNVRDGKPSPDGIGWIQAVIRCKSSSESCSSKIRIPTTNISIELYKSDAKAILPWYELAKINRVVINDPKNIVCLS